MLAALQAGQFGLITAQVAFDPFQFSGGGVVFDSGGVCLLALLVQAFVHLADHIVEERGKTSALQPVDIHLFLPLDGLQFLYPRRKRGLLAAKLPEHGFQLFRPGGLCLEPLQLFVVISHKHPPCFRSNPRYRVPWKDKSPWSPSMSIPYSEPDTRSSMRSPPPN